MKKNILLLATIAVLAPCLPVTTHAATQVYDLNADWSDTQNPNGAWSYREGTSLLNRGIVLSYSYEPVPGWVGLDNSAPGIYKSRGDIGVLPALARVGEGVANILWTAPSTGTIDISGAVWDQGAFCTFFGSEEPSSLWALSHNGNSLSAGELPCAGGYYSSSPLYFSLGSGGSGALQNIQVTAGDQMVLELGFGPFGGLDGIGINFTITLTPDSGGCPNASFAEDAILWHQPLARNGASEDTDPSASRTVKYRFKRGSTIPIQIHALGCTADVTSNSNVIGKVTVFGDSNCDGAMDDNAVPIDLNGVGGGGGVMDKIDGHLKYNLDTKTFPTTTQCYIIRVTVTDTSTGEEKFEEVLLQAK